MDPYYMAVTQFRKRNFEACINLCTELLHLNPCDEAIWTLKTRALTQEVKVDFFEGEEEGLIDNVLDDNAISSVPRPGTSLKSALSESEGNRVSRTFRPSTQSGRPMSGVLRPGISRGGSANIEGVLRTPRTGSNARPLTSSTGRVKRLGTSSLLSGGEEFINLSRLNLTKYVSRPEIGKALFEYIYHKENDIRTAMDLAAQSLKASAYGDGYWKVQLGKCYLRLGLFRDSDNMFKSALKINESVDVYLLLSDVYLRLDQPMAAIEIYNSGLEKFPNEVSLLTGVARVHEAVGNCQLSNAFYQAILLEDAINIEAIACIATSHFYSDSPEHSLRYYRRLLQMGLFNAEIYNNLGLSCFYAGQYDLSLSCFERALNLGKDEVLADIWYNIGHIALEIGDTNFAYQATRLALSHNFNHAEAYNNLGVMESRKGNIEQALAYFKTSSTLGTHLFEPNFNLSSFAFKTGDMETSFTMGSKTLEIFPEHKDSLALIKRLEASFANL
ncbi:tetratricopeptide repeat protein 8 [Lepeophtheirus salmonis]|uniref:tetratricopeptide repeat protein 8 n=1 Tax=Lepeophtheirus salmonis TaxID=72036 RepID=UPI001AE2B01B|nr:tetratricopeptide repeat protein 8-like [Lepeophtheirus salmonis]